MAEWSKAPDAEQSEAGGRVRVTVAAAGKFPKDGGVCGGRSLLFFLFNIILVLHSLLNY